MKTSILYRGSPTIAFTVIFLVKPPKLPDTMDIVSGKLATKPMVRQKPA